MTAAVLTDVQRAKIIWHCGFPNQSSDDSVIVLHRLNFEAINWKLGRLRPEEAEIVLSLLDQIEQSYSEVHAARANLEDAQLSIITHNPYEMSERRAAYTALRLDLCAMLGIEPGPYLRGGVSQRML